MKHVQSHLYLHCFQIHNRIMLKMMLFWLYTVYVAFVICSHRAVRIKSFTTRILSYCITMSRMIQNSIIHDSIVRYILGNCHLPMFPSSLSFPKISFRNTIRMSNSLDRDQARLYVGPDLGLNYLKRLTAVNTCRQSSVRHYRHNTETIEVLYVGHYQKMEESVSLLIFSHPRPPPCCFSVNNT